MAISVALAALARERINGRVLVALPATVTDLFFASLENASVGVPIVPTAAVERTFLVEGAGYLAWAVGAGSVELRHLGAAETAFDVRQLR